MPVRGFQNSASARVSFPIPSTAALAHSHQTEAPLRATPPLGHGGNFTPGPPSKTQTHPKHGGDFTPEPPKAHTFTKHGGNFTPGSSDDVDEASSTATISLSTDASHTRQDQSANSGSVSRPFSSASHASPSAAYSSPSIPTPPFFSGQTPYASTCWTPPVSASSVTIINSPRTPASSFRAPINGQGQHSIPLRPLGPPKPPVPQTPDGNGYERAVPVHCLAAQSVRSVAGSSRVLLLHSIHRDAAGLTPRTGSSLPSSFDRTLDRPSPSSHAVQGDSRRLHQGRTRSPVTPHGRTQLLVRRPPLPRQAPTPLPAAPMGIRAPNRIRHTNRLLPPRPRPARDDPPFVGSVPPQR